MKIAEIEKNLIEATALLCLILICALILWEHLKLFWRKNGSQDKERKDKDKDKK